MTTLRAQTSNLSAKGGVRPSPDKEDRGRGARFSTSIETGRWWDGCPEQAHAFIEARNRTLLFGMGMSNRRESGRAATGLRKPSLYRASTRTFYYDFADSGYVQGMFYTLRRMAAYAAGIKAAPRSPLYHVPFGELREICRTQLGPNQFEVLEVECINTNLKVPDDHRLFAWDKTTRRKALREFFRRCPPIKGYVFRICRVTSEDDTTRLGRGTSFEIPLDAVGKFIERAGALLQEVWIYLQQHPEQVELRYDCLQKTKAQRWQLHYPRSLDTTIMPLRSYVFSAEREDALFSHKHLYVGDCARTVESGKFHPFYLERLYLYSKGKLRWQPNWQVSSHQADLDIQWIQQQLAECRAPKPTKVDGGLDLLLLTALVRFLFRILPPSLPQPAGCVTYEHLPFAGTPRVHHWVVVRQRGPPN